MYYPFKLGPGELECASDSVTDGAAKVPTKNYVYTLEDNVHGAYSFKREVHIALR